jgi:hypothetical protein
MAGPGPRKAMVVRTRRAEPAATEAEARKAENLARHILGQWWLAVAWLVMAVVEIPFVLTMGDRPLFAQVASVFTLIGCLVVAGWHELNRRGAEPPPVHRTGWVW